MRHWLRILVYVASEVLIIFGIFFIVSKDWGIPLDSGEFLTILVFSVLGPVPLILTQVMMSRKGNGAQAATRESVGTKSEKTGIEALCEHLTQIGLNAAVESRQQLEGHSAKAFLVYGIMFLLLFSGFLFVFLLMPVINMVVTEGSVAASFLLGIVFLVLGVFWVSSYDPTQMKTSILGSVRVADRNIDLIELELVSGTVLSLQDESFFEPVVGYRCNYVVQARVDGLENRLKAKAKPVTVKRGFLTRELVGITWEGWELAKVLRNDVDLGDTLYRMGDRVFFSMEIRPDRRHQCVRIRPKRGGYAIPEYAFPTVKALEAHDRIARHVLSYCSASSVKRSA